MMSLKAIWAALVVACVLFQAVRMTFGLPVDWKEVFDCAFWAGFALWLVYRQKEVKGR